MVSLAACGAKRSTVSASSAGSPRMRSITRRAFIGVTRTYVARALARGFSSTCASAGWALGAMSLFPLLFSSVLVRGWCAAHLRLYLRRALRSSLTWPLNVRVGANSPSLCPTIASVTNTGTCLRPSCTASVWPIMSGTIIDRRDQVLMTFLVPFSFCVSTFFIRWSSTNGPFFRLRGICPAPYSALTLAGLAAPDDHAVAFLTAAGAALGLAPRRHRVATTGGLALTTTVRVVHRVHGDTADGRALALPPHPAGLAPVDVGLVGVADLAHRGPASYVDQPDLAGRHPQVRVRALLGQQLNAGPRRARHLGTAAG